MANDEEKKAEIVVSEQQLSLAIGKSGQNVRLAAKLTGFGIDIKSEADANVQDAEENDDEELSFTEADNIDSVEDEAIEVSEDTDVVEE